MVQEATNTSDETIENMEEQEEEKPNLLEMSDDEFLEMTLKEEEESEPSDTEDEKFEDDDTQNNEEADTNEDDDTDATEEGEVDSSKLTDDSTDENINSDVEESSEEQENAPEESEGDTQDSDSESDDSDKSDIDYKAAYEKLTAPFKANGTQIQVANVDDAITLMQMGANYHKKMAGLKPSLKVVKMLEKNNLLDPDKINYLIDLDAKKPEAIKKLIKDSGMNPMEIDVTEENKYTPEDRSVSDIELDVDNVLESIKDTPTYSKTIHVITEQWDDKSRNIIAESPHIISLINEHMADGTYDTINAVVTRERSLGRLAGYSDLEAYKTVGDLLYQQYKLPGQQAPKKAPVKPVQKKTNGITEQARKAKKRAASPTKSTKTTTSKLKVNPLAMSDEEFAKISEAQLYSR